MTAAAALALALTLPPLHAETDAFRWGTESYLYVEDAEHVPAEIQARIDAIDKTLGMRLVKMRFSDLFCLERGRRFTVDCAMPSKLKPRQRFDLDQTLALFKKNGWSLVPMLSHARIGPALPERDLDDYVDFVVWFVRRYKKTADIRYLELQNSPVASWNGTKEQLLDAQNRIYDALKKEFPDLLIGTPGFEYHADYSAADDPVPIELAEYFLEPKNGAKFDLWCYHGYNTTLLGEQDSVLAPTRRPLKNPYSGVPGLELIRKKLDEAGWKDRLIFDSENVSASMMRSKFDEKTDALDAAFLGQMLILKRASTVGGRPALGMNVSLKVAQFGPLGEFRWANLYPDGSVSKTVRAYAAAAGALKRARHDARLSGEYDDESRPWVERFVRDGGEAYAFFKPFERREAGLALDGKSMEYALVLPRRPKSLTLFDLAGGSKALEPAERVVLHAMNEPQFLQVAY